MEMMLGVLFNEADINHLFIMNRKELTLRGSQIFLWERFHSYFNAHFCRKDGFLSFQTSRYKLHYYETPTGIKVVMNTDLGVGPIRDVLHHIYSAVSVSQKPFSQSPRSPNPSVFYPW